MTLAQISDEVGPNSFYNPVCASGYLTPLQRKKLREKRKLSLSPNVTDEDKILKKPRTTSKAIKKTKVTNASKLKSKKKVLKKPSKLKDSKESFPHLQYSIAELVVQNKDDSLKEKRFFKNRSPQHLKKAKFVMPLTYKKGLEFSHEKSIISATSMDPLKVDIKQRTLKDSKTEAFAETMEVDGFKTCPNKKELISSNEKVSSNVTTNATVIKVCINHASPNSQVSQCLEASDCNKKLNCDGNKPSNNLFEFDWPSEEDLLERQNKARSLLRESQVSSEADSSFDDSKESSTNIEDTSPPKKFYPIFNKAKYTEKKQGNKQSMIKKKSLNFMDNSRGGEQLIIDAGQKEIGAKICKTCGMIYTIGQEEDEKLHAGYHQTYLINLKFMGWKKERVIGKYLDGRIIQIKDMDDNFGSRKIKDILFIVNRDLGFSTAGLPTRLNVMVLLFISSDKRVCGCLIAEGIESASTVISGETSETQSGGKTIWKLGSWYASAETVPAICGVNRIWVSHEFRRKRIASRMVDCLRQNFLYGYVVDLHELAFTDPTVDGRDFAASYTGTDNFLVYK